MIPQRETGTACTYTRAAKRTARRELPNTTGPGKLVFPAFSAARSAAWAANPSRTPVLRSGGASASVDLNDAARHEAIEHKMNDLRRHFVSRANPFDRQCGGGFGE